MIGSSLCVGADSRRFLKKVRLWVNDYSVLSIFLLTSPKDRWGHVYRGSQLTRSFIMVTKLDWDFRGNLRSPLACHLNRFTSLQRLAAISLVDNDISRNAHIKWDLSFSSNSKVLKIYYSICTCWGISWSKCDWSTLLSPICSRKFLRSSFSLTRLRDYVLPTPKSMSGKAMFPLKWHTPLLWNRLHYSDTTW